MTPPGAARRSETGAAALEFALISPVLFLVLFGIVQYGLYFNDANSMRQGVREAARAAVVENFGYAGCAGTNPAKLICLTKAQIGGSVTGAPAVKVVAPDGWAKGEALRVCAAFRSQGAVGLLPMPSSGNLRAITQMTIEREDAKAAWADATSATDPTGGAWSWC
jgi:hypothetical protein